MASQCAWRLHQKILLQLGRIWSCAFQPHSERCSSTDESCSDTESCRSQGEATVRTSGRRLRLVWDEVRPPPQQFQPEAGVVEGLFRTLAGRIGPVPVGSPIPRAVRQQRWSPVKIPLVWASTPALDWMIRAADRIRDPVEFYEGRIHVSDAVKLEWVLRSW